MPGLTAVDTDHRAIFGSRLRDGQAYGILVRLRQQVLGGIILTGKGNFRVLSYRHLNAGQNELYRGTRSRLSQVAFRLPNRKMDDSYQREAKRSDPSDETDFQND